jgi:hypothetical protein
MRGVQGLGLSVRVRFPAGSRFVDVDEDDTLEKFGRHCLFSFILLSVMLASWARGAGETLVDIAFCDYATLLLISICSSL